MPTSPVPQNTDFTRDVLGRYVCNGLDEALASSDPSLNPNARPFDVIVVGGGSFGPILAQHLLYADQVRSRRTLVLEAGRLVLTEHVQNLPILGLNVPGPISVDPGVARAEVWGMPWRTDVPRGFPGLAYCLGGRSVYFGGWSPQLLPSETPAVWPAALLADLNGPLPGGGDGYFRQASEQIGTTTTNDFIFGELHTALRAQLRQGIDNNAVTDAIPLAQLPLHLDGVPNAQQDLFKLEAPLAVQAQPPHAGFFPFNKFSSLPLLIEFEPGRAVRDRWRRHAQTPDGRARLPRHAPDHRRQRSDPSRHCRGNQSRRRSGARGSGRRARPRHDRERADRPGFAARPARRRADRRQSDGASAVQPHDPAAARGDSGARPGRERTAGVGSVRQGPPRRMPTGCSATFTCRSPLRA